MARKRRHEDEDIPAPPPLVVCAQKGCAFDDDSVKEGDACPVCGHPLSAVTFDEDEPQQEIDDGSR
jgi:predicted Zn-ribbon and HTH transcriptional regulator